MAPKYSLYSGFTVDQAMEMAGSPPSNDQYLAGEPPVDFFTQPPRDCAAIFSTGNGIRPFRFVKDPRYERDGSYWWAAEIQKTCDGLRRHIPGLCRNIESPRDFWDLYKYFDAVDIYERGAQNLWNVINMLVWENNYADQAVEHKLKAQTEYNMPLFEVLSAKLMTKSGIQDKLSRWNQEKQPDILQVFTARELVSAFVNYDEYPEHFLQAIRGIMKKHHEALQKGGSLALGPSSADFPTINVKERLDVLRIHLEEAFGDSFIEKFDIPNKIVNDVVIADGTCQTAARKAGYTKPRNDFTQACRQHEVHGAEEPITSLDVSAEDIDPSRENVEPDRLTVVSEAMRCSSAPRIGASPMRTSTDVATDKPRIHTSNGLKYDGKSSIVCGGLVHYEDATTETHLPEDAMDTVKTAQTVAYAPTSYVQPLPPPSHHGMPPHPVTGGPSQHRDLPVQRPAALPPAFVPGPIAQAPLPIFRNRGTSQGAFADQIPTYTLPQRHMQGPPPSMMPQGQLPAPAYISTNSGGNSMNGATPPYMQTQAEPQYNVPPPVYTHSHGGSTQQKRKSGMQSKGKWHQVGSDNIHGPKVIYRKDSVGGQTYNNNKGSQWQGKEPHHADRRTSTTNNTGHPRRFSNHQSPPFNTYPDPHPSENRVGTAGYTGKPRTSTSASQMLRDYGCVNATKNPCVYTKFDICPCIKCNERDRTIFVNRFDDDVLTNPGAEDRLRQHFSKFGEIQKVYFPAPQRNCVYLRFANSQSTIAAVQLEPRVHIEGMGNSSVTVDFRTGSQFFVPRVPKQTQGSSNYGYVAQNPALVQPPMMPQPPIGAPGNFNAQAQPLQHYAHLPRKPVTTPGGIPHPGHHPGMPVAADHAMDILHRGASQSGFGKQEYLGRNPITVASNPMLPLPHQPPPIDPMHTHGIASHQPVQGSGLDGAAEDLVKSTSDLPQEALMPRQTSTQGTPIKTPQSADDTPRAATPLVVETGNLAQLPKGKDTGESDKEGKYDAGTVRVRPERAQYVPIPPNWQQDNSAPPFQLDSQQVQATTEVVTAGSPLESGGKRVPSEDGKDTGEHPDAIAHGKRKASQSDEVVGVTGQVSPMKKPAKVARPDEPMPERQTGQTTSHEEQVPIQTTNGKKKKNKNKNKRRNTHDAAPIGSGGPSTSATHETRTFQPILATPYLPKYPNQAAPKTGLEESNALAASGSFFVPLPLVTLPNRTEPFPAYRDVMSGPQILTQEHQRYDSKWSLSSDESPFYQDPVKKPQGLNPVAQDFVPLPPSTYAEKSAFNPNTTVLTTFPSIPPVDGVHAGEGSYDGTHRISSKEHGWGRSNSGPKSHNGKGWFKKRQGSKYQRKSVDEQAPIGTPRPDPKPKVSTPSGFEDAVTSRKAQVSTNQKPEPTKPETSKDENSKPRSPIETSPEEPLTSGPKETKIDEQDKGKGKGKEKEVVVPKQNPQVTVATETKPTKDKKIEVENANVPESEPEPSPTQTTYKTHTTPSTSTPSTSTATSSGTTTPTTTTAAPPPPSTKSKQGKTKNKKDANAHSRADSKGKGQGQTSSSSSQQSQGDKDKAPGSSSQSGSSLSTSTPSQSASTSNPTAREPREPRKPLLKLNSADDFPALPLPSRPIPALAPIPLVALPRLGAWQKGGARSTSSPVMEKTAKTETKGTDGEGRDKENNKLGKEKDKGSPPPLEGERKGG